MAAAPLAIPPSSDDPYHRAGALARTGRFSEAAALYQQLARSADRTAELALYELGRLRRLHLRDARGAVAAFGESVRRFPAGVLAQEARLSLIESHLAARAFDEAAAAIDGFLAVHAGSERRDEVLLLQAHVARERSGCAAALVGYDRLANLDGLLGAEALYFSAVCDQQLGRPDSARAKLERYRHRHPEGRQTAEVERALRGAP